LRNRAAATLKPLPKKQRTKKANGRLVLNGRSYRGRRTKELVEIYGVGVDLADAQMAGLVKSTAVIAFQVEQLEDASERGELIDLELLNRLVNTRERNRVTLKEMRTQVRSHSPEHATGGPAALTALQRHLHYLAWTRGRSKHYAKGVNDPELIAEYDRREAQGEFLVRTPGTEGCSQP
jgi:hypothetical protein